jgi:hypothetical protein
VLLEGMAMNREIALQQFSVRDDPEQFDRELFFEAATATRQFAEAAAPFCHSRLAPKRPDGELPNLDLNQLTEAQIDILVLRLNGRTADAPTLDLAANAAGAVSEGGG